MIDTIVCAVKNLYRMKLRSFLTILGIVIGVTSVSIVWSLGDSGKAAVSEQFDQFGLGGLLIRSVTDQNGKKYAFKSDDQEIIEGASRDITDVMPLKYCYGVCASDKGKRDTVVWGVAENVDKALKLRPLYGNTFTARDVRMGANVCVIDTETALRMFKKENAVGQIMTLMIGTEKTTVKVIGVVDGSGSILNSSALSMVPSFIYMPYTSVQKINGEDMIDQFVVNVSDSDKLDSVGEKISMALDRAGGVSGGFFAENMVKQKKQIDNIIGMIAALISAVAAVSLIVGGLGIMSIMLSSVTERTREIGIKKAIGASKGAILREFISESAVITLIGGGMGVSLTYSILFFADKFLGFSITIKPTIIIMSLLFSGIIGIIFSIYPAKKAADLNPISALRRE